MEPSESADVAAASIDGQRALGRALFTLVVSRGGRALPLYELVRRRTEEEEERGWQRFKDLHVPVIVLVAWSLGASPGPEGWLRRQFAVADDGVWLEDVLVRKHTVRTRGVHAPWFATAGRELAASSGFDPWGEFAAIEAAISEPYRIAADEPALERRSGVFRDGTVHYVAGS